MKSLPQVLICDDDKMFHLAAKHTLKGKFECRSAHHTEEAIAILRKHPVDILLLDVQMRTPTEGLDAIPAIRELDPLLSIVMSSGLTDFPTVREALRRGANDYVPKDFNPDDLIHTLEGMLERRKLSKRVAQSHFEITNRDRNLNFIGESAPVLHLKKTLERIRGSSANVLITGETGTGKEVVARLLRGSEQDGSPSPFIAVDSATIQGSTAESVLFGHEKGAFTGADKLTKGVFEEADGGSVYFDELGNMPMNIQAKLLRAIQEKEILRLGSSKPLQLEFRVICATNRDLEKMIQAGDFKDDLYQRLAVLPIHVPALRERTSDIPLLLAHFAKKTAGNQPPLEFSESTIELLMHYSWPGNIRELSNLVAYLRTMTDAQMVEPEDLPPKIRDQASALLKRPTEAASDEKAVNFYEAVATFEKDFLLREQNQTQGNVSRMAMRLGMDRSHLYSKLREHGLHAGKSKN